jgi:hypothetical protein
MVERTAAKRKKKERKKERQAKVKLRGKRKVESSV